MVEEQTESALKFPGHSIAYELAHPGEDPELTPVLEDDLPLNLRLGSGSLNAHDAEHLRVVMLGLIEKLKGMYLLR
jgi:hypothetical protein